MDLDRITERAHYLHRFSVGSVMCVIRGYGVSYRQQLKLVAMRRKLFIAALSSTSVTSRPVTQSQRHSHMRINRQQMQSAPMSL